jgi:3-oxoacyl-[acyl-carrier protein] reductase
MIDDNSGIGAGVALRLARDGAKVVVNYQNDKKSADAVVAAINSVRTNNAIAVQADVSKSAEVDRLFAEAKRAFGRIDIVIANSGVVHALSTIADFTNDEFNRIFSVNVTGNGH